MPFEAGKTHTSLDITLDTTLDTIHRFNYKICRQINIVLTAVMKLHGVYVI